MQGDEMVAFIEASLASEGIPFESSCLVMVRSTEIRIPFEGNPENLTFCQISVAPQNLVAVAFASSRIMVEHYISDQHSLEHVQKIILNACIYPMTVVYPPLRLLDFLRRNMPIAKLGRASAYLYVPDDAQRFAKWKSGGGALIVIDRNGIPPSLPDVDWD